MSEHERRMLVKLPAVLVGPDRGQFAAGEPGLDAHYGVVTSDVVAANHPQQATCQMRQHRAAGLAGNEQWREKRHV